MPASKELPSLLPPLRPTAASATNAFVETGAPPARADAQAKEKKELVGLRMSEAIVLKLKIHALTEKRPASTITEEALVAYFASKEG